MGTKRKSLGEGELLAAALDKAKDSLEVRGALTNAQLGPSSLRARVAEQLVVEGYERTAKGVRVRAESQLDKLLTDGAYLSVSELPKRLAGVTKGEAEALLKGLSRDRGAVVLRGSQLTLVPGSADVVDREALSDLAGELKRLLTWVQKAQKDKSGATLLRSDLAESLTELTASGRTEGTRKVAKQPAWREPSAPASDEPVSPSAALRGAILALRDEDSRLARVPDVSRRLAKQMTSEQIKKELLAAHTQGLFELRPEGGIGRLSPDDASLCPLGAGGIPLSYVRLLEN